MINSRINSDSAAFADYYDTPRTAMFGLLNGIPAPVEVLEIGCGGGASLSALKRCFPGVRTTGIDAHPAAVEMARKRRDIDEVHFADALDHRAVAFDPARFDLIILSHVLEHLPQPELMLQRCKPWLAPHGRLLVALPNVRHASVLAELIFKSDFRYRAAGILDHTHLRFFTRRSAIRFFEEQGLTPLSSAAEIKGWQSRLLLWCSLGIARDLSAYANNFLLAWR